VAANPISQTLAMLLRQQESHYGELLDLEEKLRKHRLAYLQLGEEISAQIKHESLAGFKLVALTERGKQVLPDIIRRLPHGEGAL
jgi:hypothetical protein